MVFLYSDFNETIKGYDGETGKLKFEIKANSLNNLNYLPYLSRIVVNDSTLYSLSDYSHLGAFDSSTGTSRWSVDLGTLSPDEVCRDIKFVADGVYIVCTSIRQNSRTIRRLLFLNGQTGQQQWVKFAKYSDDGTYYFDSGIAIDSKSFAAWIQKIGSHDQLVTFNMASEHKLWTWQPEYEINEFSFSTTDERIFMLGSVSRRQNLMSKFSHRSS